MNENNNTGCSPSPENVQQVLLFFPNSIAVIITIKLFCVVLDLFKKSAILT